ncbi:MAG TPA: efflux RND transporter periplasmic adaptor subunit [Gemmatimonadales bacterium]|nr:efflux RND transporter periplasmic adaptor subunit [Gemmatimonadales bacterium]
MRPARTWYASERGAQVTYRTAPWHRFVAIAAFMLGCSKPPPATANAGEPSGDPNTSDEFVLPPEARGVVTEPVETLRVANFFEVTGRIAADPTRVVRVYPPVSGRLVAVDVRPADYVEQGQVLAVLASSDVAAARAAYRQAQADAQVKQQALERSRLLFEHQVIALRDYQQAQADAAMAAAALQGALQRLDLLSVDTASSSDELVITAPRAGVVTDLGAAPGEYSKSLDNSAPLCTIADLATVWAVGDVYERDLASVRVGDSADVVSNAYPDEHRRGRIAAISSTVDTTTRTLKVRVVLANPGFRLKPDMFATIRVVRALRRAIVVPQAAVVREGTAAYVFVETAPNHFRRRAVTLGRDTDRSQVEVTSGLAPGESLVTRGAELLRAVGTASS